MVVGERSVEQAAVSCQRPANMAMQTIKGMYVNNEMTAITRQRNRHDRASAAKHVSSFRPVPEGKLKTRTKLNLRVVQRHRLLRISPSDNPRLWHTPHCADPPERKEHRSEVE